MAIAELQKKIELPFNKELPYSTEAEALVLGGMMLDPEGQAYDKIADIITIQDFYHLKHKKIFEAIQTLTEAGKLADPFAVADWLDSSGNFAIKPAIHYVIQLVDTTPGIANIRGRGEVIRDKALLRELIDISHTIVESASNPEGRSPSQLVDDAEQKIFEIAERGSRSSTYLELRQMIKPTYDRLYERSQKGGGLSGTSTCFRELDKLTAGLQEGELIIIAGRPSMGKTAFALNIAEHIALSDKNNPVAIFSMEMSAEQLTFRMISSLGMVHGSALKTGKLTDKDWDRVDGAIQQMKEAPIFIDDTPSLTPVELRARARRIQRERGLSLIVIDYLQLMQVPGSKENRATEISEITRNLKALARELQIPIIALAQLNRSVELRTDKTPLLSDLRESGSIEQDADLIGFIYRDEVYNKDTDKKGQALINIAKQRNGPTGDFILTFLGRYTKFENYIPSVDDY